VVRELGIQIAQGLAAAHAANVVHRDVKPANILASNGVWKLADFGIARVPDSTLTIEGQFLGSPWYAAPESLRAGVFAPASDVYGLGATLYEAATGKPPHGTDDLGALMKHIDQDPPPPHGMPEPIAAAILAALARDPAHRPSAEQLAHMLVPPQPAPRTRWTRLTLALGVAAAVLIALLVASRGSSTPSAAAISPQREPAASNPATETAPNPATETDAEDPTLTDDPRDDDERREPDERSRDPDDRPREPYDDPREYRSPGRHGKSKHKHH
jgi:serine/threonine-protein kinase